MDVESNKNDIQVQNIQNMFEERKCRLHLVRMVYGIMTAMLLVDAGFIAAGFYVPCINAFLRENIPPLIISAAIFAILFAISAFLEFPTHRAPYNYLLLMDITIFAGYVLATVAARVSQMALLLAVAGTCFVVLSVSLIAVFCSYDFTRHPLLVFATSVSAAAGTITFTLASIFILCLNTGLLPLAIWSAFLVLFSMKLTYDTQMVMSGGRHQLKCNEHMYGAQALWATIVFIFLNQLHISQLIRSIYVQFSPHMIMNT